MTGESESKSSQTPSGSAGTELAATVARLVQRGNASKAMIHESALIPDVCKVLEPVCDNVVIVRSQSDQSQTRSDYGGSIDVPGVSLSRLDQIKIAIFMGLTSEQLTLGDRVAVLVGLAGSADIDTLMVIDVEPEQELLSGVTAAAHLPNDVRFEVFQKLLALAVEIGNEGREGKPIGALFVLGDTERVVELSRPLILNPFRGYSESERSLIEHDLDETVKELASIDGAFAIRGDGVVEACGLYLKASESGDSDLPEGLGARHHAAAAITAMTDALAITVSESTGTVTVFRDGKQVTQLDRVHPLRSPPANPR